MEKDDYQEREQSSSTLSLGFIGGSLNSAVGYTHFAASTMDRKWSVKAGSFSPDKKRNIEAAHAYGTPLTHAYSNWQEMVEKEKKRLDAIAILTPTPSHQEMVISCLNHGIPVICEKAMAINSKQGKEISRARTENNGFLAVTYNYSGYPMVRELRSIIKKGRLGKLLHFQAEMPQEGFIRIDSNGNKPIVQSWRLSDGPLPTIYLDLAVHLHQLLFYLTGQKPTEVVSDHKCYGNMGESVIDNVISLCKYSNDMQGQLWFSKTALGHRNGLKIRIYGSKASAEWYQASPEELILATVDGKKQIIDRAASVEVTNQRRYNRFKAGHPAGFIEAFANLYDDIAHCLLQYKETGKWSSDEVFGDELAVEGLYMFEAMIRSIRSGAWHKI